MIKKILNKNFNIFYINLYDLSYKDVFINVVCIIFDF